MIEHLTLLQLDPTAAVAPNADLVAWSRIGATFETDQLRRGLELDRTLFEHRHREDPSSGNIAVIRPMSSIGWYLADMYALRTAPGTVRDWLDANAAFQRRVLDQLTSDGPTESKRIPDTASVPWKSTGWTGGRNVTQLLEFLASRGLVAVSARRGKQRLWDLADRVYPTDVAPIPVEEARRLRDIARLRALGVARPKHVRDAGELVEVAGTGRTWRIDPEHDAEDFEPRTALLSPFDRLVHARDRARELFNFDYVIEIYKPEHKRRRGFFALPVLHGDELVGSIDIKADHARATLRVLQIVHDQPWSQRVQQAVDKQVQELAGWLGLEAIDVEC